MRYDKDLKYITLRNVISLQNRAHHVVTHLFAVATESSLRCDFQKLMTTLPKKAYATAKFI